MGKLSLTLAIVLVLSPCVAKEAKLDLSEWRGKTLAITSGPRTTLAAVTQGKALLLGATGGADNSSMAAGAKLAEADGIENSAAHLAEDLSKAATEHYGLIAGAPVMIGQLANDHDIINNAPPGTDLVLDVELYGTVFSQHLPFDRRYDVRTSVWARIIDVHAKKRIAEADCKQSSHSDPNPPTYDELTLDAAARLKAMIEKQRSACFEQFRRELLHIAS